MATIKIPAGGTIQTVINSNPPGTTFQLGAGYHRMQPIYPRTGDRFEGVMKSGKLATFFSGAKVLSAWTFNGYCWFADGQTQQGDVVHDPNNCDKDHPRCEHPNDVFFDDELKEHVADLAQVGPGTWHFDYAANRIYVGDNPHGCLVETSVTPHVFVAESAASNVRMQSLVIEKFASPTSNAAVNLGDSPRGGLQWELRRCEVRYNHGLGVWNDSATVTRECNVHHNGNSGMGGAGLGIIVEGNEIAWNNTCGYNPFWGGGGSKWVWTDGLIVRANWCHHNRGPGLWTDINNIRTLYERNLCEFNTRAGIFHEIGYDAVVRRNRVRFNGTARDYPHWTTGAGIEIVGSRNVEVYENDLVDNWQGITGLMDYRHDPNAPHGAWELVNLHVHDNRVRSTIYIGEGGGRSGVAEVGGTGVFDPAKNNRFERNHYTLAEATGRAWIWAGVDHEWAGWQNNGQDRDGSLSEA